MFRTIAKLATIAVLSCLLISVALSQGETLRYQVDKGVTHQYKLNTENVTKAQMMGQDFTTNATNALKVSVTGEDVGKNGTLIFVAKIDENLSSIDSPMMRDSARVMKEINGKRVRVTVSGVGRTVDVTAIDSIPPPAGPQMGPALNPTELMRRFLVELPEKAVATGDSWKQTRPDTISTQGLKIIVKPDVTYKIVGTEKKGEYDCLKITFEGTSTQYGTGSRQGMELILDGTSKTKGTAYFAPKQGLMVLVDQTASQEMSVTGAGEQMFSMNQSTTSKSKITLLK